MRVKERRERAYRAHAELIKTAESLLERARRRLDAFDLSVGEYRMMEEIYRHGPQYRRELARRVGCSHRNIDLMAEKLGEMGWARCVAARYVAKQRVGEGWKATKKKRKAGSFTRDVQDLRRGGDRDSEGRAVNRIFLTEEGRERIGEVMRAHAKYVETEMRALDGRELQTMRRMCGKLMGKG